MLIGLMFKYSTNIYVFIKLFLILPLSFQSYNTFIEKTKAELNKEPDSTPDTRSQVEDSTSKEEQTGIKPPAHRYKKHL